MNKLFSYPTQRTAVASSPVQFSYTQSEILALQLGYREVQDPQAYRGRYFIQNGKKWIHNLEALRKKLHEEYGHYITDEELSAPAPEGFGYDVEAYYAYNYSSSSFSNTQAFKDLMQKVRLH